MSRRRPVWLFPSAEGSRGDNGLRFTDILFGFVIRELFIRLQHWTALPHYEQAQLITAAALVLGSWIGFRRSLNRSRYELKFFNLPIARFVLDQLMLVAYFRIATLTPTNVKRTVDPSLLTHSTVRWCLAIFFLYLLWDVLGICSAAAGRELPTYPRLADDGTKTTERARKDYPALLITCAFLALLVGIYFLTRHWDVSAGCATWTLWTLVVCMLAYRWVKEIKTSLTSGGAPIPDAAAVA